MTPEEAIKQLAKLREPFKEHQISKLPKPTAKREVMDALPKAMCPICHNYHATSKVIHLDYVGHAALTDRLLDVDPFWNWEPLTMDDKGLPLLDGSGGMWIKLTICGITRLGYGDADGKTGGNAVKERIGDALRNAAMRFGAALDLWHKGDLHVDSNEWSDEDCKAAHDRIFDLMDIMLSAGWAEETAKLRVKLQEDHIGDPEIDFARWENRYLGLCERVQQQIDHPKDEAPK